MGRAAVSFANGTVNQNVEPAPGELSTSIRPPMVSIRCRAVDSPRPTPEKRRVLPASICENFSNSSRRSSSEMPMPVSRTSKRTTRCVCVSVCSVTRSVTFPCSVNLTAFSIRFVTTCRSLD